METLTGYTLPAGNFYNNGLTFSTAGLFSMVPGTYYVGVFYRPTGGDWVLVGDNGSYTNFAQVTVINPNDIEVSQAMAVTPGTTLTQGGQVSVTLNVQNDGFNTFIGQYGLALYNLDGTWAQDIGVLNENNGLPSGYTYNPPGLTFGPVAVTIPPGTYLLAMQHNPNNTGWQLTGSSYFDNPIFVTVVGASLSPDQYEANNAAAQAYSLPVNFAGNNASTNTTGSNLHVTTDLDFYKVVLPGGYDYSITARVHDSYDSDNGNSYSADALWSYSTDGNTWSAAYDDVMTGPIVVTGGGTVTFHVAPYFAGETGSYLLQLDMVRAPNVGIAEVVTGSGIPVFPNPAQERLNVDLSSIGGTVRAMELIDVRGSLVQLEALPTSRDGWSELNIASVSEGSYILRIVTDEAVRTQQIVVAR
ncbi:MAG: T9SS type A sorting domain-containing protein [Flavobacteriales bacterium]|nr:T9SS type A sorting domain-containing protein [Flavobacteriales bacterium]